MPHTPYQWKDLQRTDINFIVPLSKVGLLYQGEVPVATLRAGQGLTVKQRISPGSLRICLVDLAPHSLEWRVALPMKGDHDTFSVTINLKYRISNAQRMLDDQVKDTEIILIQALEPGLRRVSRSFLLDQHLLADDALTEKIKEIGLKLGCGLEIMGCDVVINLSKEQIAILESLHLPKVSEHRETVPSKSPNESFEVTVTLTYTVADLSQLPSGSAAEAEKQLWPRIHRAIRRSAAKFELTQISDADADMQETLLDLMEGGKLKDFGLITSDIQIVTDLDSLSLKRYGELAEQQHQAALKKAQLDGLQPSFDFYKGLIQQGSLAALAVAVSQGDITAKQFYDTLNAEERHNLDLQMQILRDYRSANVRDEKQDYESYKQISDKVTNKVTSEPHFRPDQKKLKPPNP